MNLYDKYTEWNKARRVESARSFISEKGIRHYVESAAFLFGYASALGWNDEGPKSDEWIEWLRQVNPIKGEIKRGADCMAFTINVQWQGLNLNFYDWEPLAASLSLMELIEIRDKMEKAGKQ